VTAPFTGIPDAQGTAADRLRGIEAVTDAALSRLDEQSLLNALAERVKNVLQADTAAVLLLDQPAGQLVATAASGIEEEVRQGVRIPLGAGFAGRVAASREPVILTAVDHTTVRNPLLVDRGIRSLLGVPLLAGGNVIGVLHVGSLSDRIFGQQDVELLQMAADRAALALYSLMAQDDALAALALQRSLLPTALPAVPGLDLAARYVTGSGTVGGDWYDVFVLPDGRLGVVVGDVAGSGLEAAVIMGRMRSALRAYVLESADPATALRLLDRKIQYFEPDAMATVLYGLYSPGTGEFTVSSAGHLPPVLAAPGAPAALLPLRPDPPIGSADDPQRRSTTAFIPPGALLCCFTDGLVERRDQVIDRGIDLLAAVLDERVDASDPDGANATAAEDACAAVMRTLVGNSAAPDDIAILILNRRYQTGLLRPTCARTGGCGRGWSCCVRAR
jgi:sigma-B regulation protein RsbU (phosphoserine phosphatase)